MDPKVLADVKLPDGLTVSMQSGIKHTPRGMTDAPKEWDKFLNGMRSNPKEDWWRKNLDLPAYFSFHALNRLLGNVDVSNGERYLAWSTDTRDVEDICASIDRLLPELGHDAPAMTNSFPDRIKIGPNLRFWGTINYDETTERLSPRLLDRTGMIVLGPGDIVPIGEA